MKLISKFGKLFVEGTFSDIPVLTGVKNREFMIRSDVVLFKYKPMKGRTTPHWVKFKVAKCTECSSYFTYRLAKFTETCRQCKIDSKEHVLGSIAFKRKTRVFDRLNSDRDFSNLVSLILTSNFKLSDVTSAYSYCERVRNRGLNGNNSNQA